MPQMLFVIEMALVEFPYLALTPNWRCFPWHGQVLPARPKGSQCPLWDISLLSPPRANSPPLAPQIGVTETGLQHAILKRAQDILAVAKMIPGTTSSFLPGL